MTPAKSFLYSGFGNIIIILLISNLKISFGDEFRNEETARSMYLAHGSHLGKTGWRPILTSDSLGAINLAQMFAGGHTVGQKILTGPALIETKVISPHIVNVSPFTNELFTNAIVSTSTRPLVTRDANKLTTITQGYKTAVYPQSSINLNAPINSYVNPFSIPTGPGISTYKINTGLQQYDNGFFIKHQQPMITYRPGYNKYSGQMNPGKRLKHPNQMQNHLHQQLPNNYRQINHQYQNMKKPVDSYQRPIDIYNRPFDNFQNLNSVNHQNHVNPQDSLLTQIKTKPQSSQNIAAVTYKPPFNSHFQQFGIKEEPFGPIPSSILGSFSSFGHASVKAREPGYSSKINHSPSTTKPPVGFTESYSSVSTVNVKLSVPTAENNKVTHQKQNPISIKDIKDDYLDNLVPPPKTISFTNTPNKSNDISKQIMQGDFIPSPLDPLNKYQNPSEILKLHGSKSKQPYNPATKRPEITSFFDTTSPVSTSNPFDVQSTNIVPENLLVQLPPPYKTINTYIGQPVRENFPAQHNKPTKYNSFDDNNFYSPTRGQELFGSKHVKHNIENINKIPPQKGGYEVTENWGSSGEYHTQPTPYTWVNSAQSQQYDVDLRPPPVTYEMKPVNEEKVISPSSLPPVKVSEPNLSFFNDVSTVYSTIDETNNQNYYSQLENTLASNNDLHENKPSINEDVVSPINDNFEDQEKHEISSTPIYEEVTNQYKYEINRKKPVKQKTSYETSTIDNLDQELTTVRYETYKEPTPETDKDIQINNFPTIPPNRHFKRPVTNTPIPLNTWEEKLKRKNKNRRRRPISYSTTELINDESFTVTESNVRSHKHRTTTSLPDVEEQPVKTVRPRLRFPSQRTRFTTKPTTQPEVTSSAQPTTLPTTPIKSRTKLHSRIRLTTMSPLDIDDITDATTIRTKYNVKNEKQSSIMKIAKDHSNRLPTIKFNTYRKPAETPDYTHKQDEKDTPTSDVSVNTSGHKFSAQKLQNDYTSFEENSEEKIYKPSSEESKINYTIDTNLELDIEKALSAYENEASQTTRSEKLYTEQRLGNREHVKPDENSQEKDISNETFEPSNDVELLSTTPLTITKTHRLKLKPGKYDINRPRFSVKDYRNRLNQYSTPTTEKSFVTSEMSSINRLKFPNRTRFPSFKEQQDNKFQIQETSTTELPRKKFIPKDHRYKEVNNENEVKEKDNFNAMNATNQEQENEIMTKAKIRGNLRRDPNRLRTTTTTDFPIEDNVYKLNNNYTIVKRPNINGRRRIQIKYNATESINNNLETLSLSTERSDSKNNEIKNETSTEKYTSETAIMKIAKDDRKHNNNDEIPENSSMDQSQRVSDLTLASSKEYNTPGLFKSVSQNTRRVPNYFTIATDDPILPIEAFFPQLNQKKE